MLNNLAQLAYRARYLINSNSPTILTAVGVGGTVATAVLTGKATFKAADIINDEELEFPVVFQDDEIVRKHLSKTEKLRMVWPLYIPPVVAGSLTVGAIISANRISSGRVAALVVASGVSERALQEYKDKVVEKLGPKQSQAVQDEISQDRVTKNPPSGQVNIFGMGEVLCMDSLTGRYFKSTAEKIRRAENTVNREILNHDYCSLSFFFSELEVPPTQYTDMVGWNVQMPSVEAGFTTTMTEQQEPCLVINFNTIPAVGYDKVWS